MKMKQIWNIISLVISGIVIGLLAGISASPVVQILLTTIFSMIAGLISGFSGVLFLKGVKKREDAENEHKAILDNLNAVPLMFLLLGIGAGTLSGVHLRTHNWLGRSVESVVSEWKGKIPLEDTAIAMRIFNLEFPNVVETKVELESIPETHLRGELFGGEAEICLEYKNLEGEDLRRALLRSPHSALRLVAKIDSTDYIFMKQFVNELCK